METKSFNLLDQQHTTRKIVADKNNPSFFILNTTDKPDSRTGRSTRELGMLLFTVMSSGQGRIVRVPPSYVPVDAAQQASKEEIYASAEFQRALASGSIMILTHDQGEKIIKADRDSMEEYTRVMAVAMGVNGADSGFGYQEQSGRTEDGALDPWANVSPDVKLNVEEMLAETMSEAQFRSFMRRSERSISALDRQYIADKLPNFNMSTNMLPINGGIQIQA